MHYLGSGKFRKVYRCENYVLKVEHTPHPKKEVTGPLSAYFLLEYEILPTVYWQEFIVQDNNAFKELQVMFGLGLLRRYDVWPSHCGYLNGKAVIFDWMTP